MSLTGIINALRPAGKKMSEAKFVLFCASNWAAPHPDCWGGGGGRSHQKFNFMFDTKECLMHKNRLTPHNNYYRKWKVCV